MGSNARSNIFGPDTDEAERHLSLYPSLGHRIVIAVSASAHRMNQIVVPEERCPVHAGEPGALIRVDQHLFLRLAPPYSHEQSLQYDVGGLAALHCPADHTTRIEVKDDSQISETFAGSDVGDIRHPGRVWSCHIKLSVERVVDGDGRPTTIDAGTAFVANLCPDSGKAGQTRNSVRAAHLTLIEKIVVQLAITIDLAAFFPCLQEQIGRRLSSPARVLSGFFSQV